MTKHIVMFAHAYGFGTYGVGDTKKEATANARKEWKAVTGGKIKEIRHRTVEVPEGSKLVVQALCNGVQWWIETTEVSNDSQGTDRRDNKKSGI